MEPFPHSQNGEGGKSSLWCLLQSYSFILIPEPVIHRKPKESSCIDCAKWWCDSSNRNDEVVVTGIQRYTIYWLRVSPTLVAYNIHQKTATWILFEVEQRLMILKFYRRVNKSERCICKPGFELFGVIKPETSIVMYILPLVLRTAQQQNESSLQSAYVVVF